MYILKSASDRTDHPVGPVTYRKLFWLFLIGSVFGLLLEGVWYLHIHSRWESHVTTMVLPLCSIYGFGFAGGYAGCVALQKKPMWVRFLFFALAGSLFEFLCGMLLEKGLQMRAWNYSKTPMNIRGHVNLTMTLFWGILGVLFTFLLPSLEQFLARLEGEIWRKLCLILSVVVILDMASAAVCITRWSNRHYGKEAANVISEYIDEHFDDDFMSTRFMEWRFIKNPQNIRWFQNFPFLSEDEE